MNPRCGLVKAGESKLTEEEDISKGEDAVGVGGGQPEKTHSWKKEM